MANTRKEEQHEKELSFWDKLSGKTKESIKDREKLLELRKKENDAYKELGRTKEKEILKETEKTSLEFDAAVGAFTGSKADVLKTITEYFGDDVKSFFNFSDEAISEMNAIQAGAKKTVTELTKTINPLNNLFEIFKGNNPVDLVRNFQKGYNASIKEEIKESEKNIELLNKEIRLNAFENEKKINEEAAKIRNDFQKEDNQKQIAHQKETVKRKLTTEEKYHRTVQIFESQTSKIKEENANKQNVVDESKAKSLLHLDQLYENAHRDASARYLEERANAERDIALMKSVAEGDKDKLRRLDELFEKRDAALKLEFQALDLQEQQQSKARQALQFEEELRNEKEKGIKAQEAVQIDASGMQNVLAKNNEAIAKRTEEAEKKSHKTRIDQWKEYANKVEGISKDISEKSKVAVDSLGGMLSKMSESYKEQVDELNKKIASVDEDMKAKQEEVALTEDEQQSRKAEIAEQQMILENATTDEQRAKAQDRINILQDELTAETRVGQEFEVKKAELEKEKEKKEKAQRKADKLKKKLDMGQSIVTAIGNVAAGVAQALSFGPILGPILATIVAAAGAVQVGIMTKQLAKFEDGGLLSGKRHSAGGMRIQGSNIEVEGGEYVVNRQSTDKNLGLIRYINSQRRELAPTDLNSFFAKSSQGFEPPFRQAFAQGGQLPNIEPTTNIDNELLVQAIQSIKFEPKVSVTDINTVQSDIVKVDAWTGM